MKNRVLMIVLAAIMVFSMVAAGCTPKATKLETPVVTVDASGVATWKAVANASSYTYKIDDGKEVNVNTNKVTLTDGQSIRVKAIGDGKNFTDSDYSAAVTFNAAEVKPAVGLPQPELGYYISNADVIEESDTVRYIVYTTNEASAENYNLIAVRKGEKAEDGWVYGEEHVAIIGADGAWDTFIGSASMVKGVFALDGTTYNYLIAYCATDDANDCGSQIGLAVAQDPLGDWVKVGTAPVITFDRAQYGQSSVGCYAPSVVNYDKASGIRIFYTYADAYGHFAHMWDANLADLSKISGQTAMLPHGGNLHSGDAVLMFPNADFCYDAENDKFYTVKDYSPAASDEAPYYANQIELGRIDESELYTIETGRGWESIQVYDYIDLETDYERLYSACIVSDAYGHMLSGDIEVIYNVCMTESQNADYLYTQVLHTVTYSAEE